MEATEIVESTQASLKHISGPGKDLELNHTPSRHLDNAAVRSFSWRDVGVIVKDRHSKQPLSILSALNGHVEAGQMVALMGPSGSGKTTLLDVLASRLTKTSQVTGDVLVNDQPISQSKLRQISCFVEQEDHLIGSLTVRETIDFAARLSLPSSISKTERMTRVDDLVQSFGMQQQATTLVGTPIRKGISGGQKRRLSVASQLVTSPKVLFLDEPTSGLDSVASFETINYIKEIAVRHHLIVIASIHQPSTTTFQLFDQLMLLSGGRACYFGPRDGIQQYFARIGHEIPFYINPAEFLLDLVNFDFARDKAKARNQLEAIHESWTTSAESKTMNSRLLDITDMRDDEKNSDLLPSLDSRSKMLLPFTLLHRSFIKSYRDVIAYGIRLAMYTGLAIMMGTVWLRLSNHQSSITSFINAIFFGGAFMSFMAVAYIPAIIEDLQTFKKERANGLYGPLPFIIANTIIGIPYLFFISVIFSIIAYWLSNFKPTATAFFTWVLWLFLDLLAAEGLVVLVTSVVPIFVVALAVVAFANGLWMSVGGFLVPLGTLNPFWKYVFHYIDYQAYVFQGMMVNQFKDTNYLCDAVSGSSGYNCMYPSDLQSVGKIRGTAVLSTYKIDADKTGEWVGIMIAIIVVYRILGYLALRVGR